MDREQASNDDIREWLRDKVTKEYFESIDQQIEALEKAWRVPMDSTSDEIARQQAMRMGNIQGLEFCKRLLLPDEEDQPFEKKDIPYHE